MCGIAGFIGVSDYVKRAALVKALGDGIDTRGGDAAGYVSVSPYSVRYGRVVGTWGKASKRFSHAAAAIEGATLMHARYATCGKGGELEAHPYRIERPGFTLWGAHNGVVYGLQHSAKQRGREYDVDSREVFHLLADGELKEIKSSTGWGVLSWIDDRERQSIKLVKMTSGGCLEVVKTECGAVVYASTWPILKVALNAAGMKSETAFKIEKGVVYEATKEGLFETAHPHITLNETWGKGAGAYVSHYDMDEDVDTWDYARNGWKSFVEKWKEERAEREKKGIVGAHSCLTGGGSSVSNNGVDAKKIIIINSSNDNSTALTRYEERQAREAAWEKAAHETEDVGASPEAEVEIEITTNEDEDRDSLLDAVKADISALDYKPSACPSCLATDTATWGDTFYCNDCGYTWDLEEEADNVASSLDGDYAERHNEEGLSEAEVDWIERMKREREAAE